MDNRRLDTLGAINDGVLLRGAPTTEIPGDRESVSSEGLNHEAIVAAVEAGKIVEACNYYGIPHVWRASPGVYRGTLLQYCRITEDPTFATVEEATEWFEDSARNTDG